MINLIEAYTLAYENVYTDSIDNLRRAGFKTRDEALAHMDELALEHGLDEAEIRRIRMKVSARLKVKY